MEDENIVASLDQVRCYEIPAKSTGARNRKWLCCRIGAYEQFSEHGEGLSKDIHECSANMALTTGQVPIRQSESLREWTEAYLGCAIDSRTPSSNSTGPGINRIG